MGASFTSLMNYWENDYVMGHLLRRAREVGLGSFEVDLLTGTSAPPELCTPPVLGSVASYVQRFPENLVSQGSAIALVRSARLRVDFDLSTTRPAPFDPSLAESPYVCRVEITDDRGKLWEAVFRGWWFPEPQPRPPKRWLRFLRFWKAAA
jgi:hypothetical protein